jgi:hypothetical protein
VPSGGSWPIVVKIIRKDNVALSLAEALAFKLPREIGLQLNGHYLMGNNGRDQPQLLLDFFPTILFIWDQRAQ